ncbi:MAG: hypothetical protein JKX69_05730 [Rhodobacteraceae bacterium]|nr:hypothetical protein [Paracoccaceae bacterium]
MRNIVFGALASMAMVGGAQAQCLTDADLTRGVTVRFSAGDYTKVRRLSDGYLRLEEHYDDGAPPMFFRAHRGVYFVQEYELDGNGQEVPGTRLDIEFQIDPARLPDPLPGLSWEGASVNVFADGGRRNEVTSVRFYETDDMELSGCVYETVGVDLRYDWGVDGGLSLSYVYLPAVGTAIILSNQFDGDERNSTTPISLERTTK